VVLCWAVVQTSAVAPSGWQTAVDVIAVALVHGLAAMVAVGSRRPGTPGATLRTFIALGLTIATVMAVGGLLLGSGPPSVAAVVSGGWHLVGRLYLVVLVISLALFLHDRLLWARVGLDALSATLGLTALGGIAAVVGSDLPARLLVLACVDVGLLAVVVALCSILRPGRGSIRSELALGAGLVLATDLYVGYLAHTGGATTSGVVPMLGAATCVGLAQLATKLTSAADIGHPEMADRLAGRSNVLPFAGAGAVLLAVLLADRSPRTLHWVPLLAVAGMVCLAMVATRFLLTLRVARSALERLEDSLTDPLTGLLNRRGLSDRLDQWLDAAQPVTLLALDLAEFRRINEEAGHETGDRVLRRVADQLSALAAQDTVVARIDGDDFALAFPALDPARASLLAADVRDLVGRPFDLDAHRLHLRVNVGTTTAHPLPRDLLASADTLLRCADQALARAQSTPTGTAVHDPAQCGLVHADRPLAWVDELHAALAAADQLLLHFQPQCRVDPGGTASVVVGCEALLRWAHPTRGLLGPAEALRAADHGHLGSALAERVLNLALTAVSGWWDRHPVPVAVNLSATDLDDDELPHRIQAALARHGVPAAALTVEIVEDTLMLNPHRALATLTALRAIGLRISVDDYGTGYSSLAYLHRLPINEVKFDRSLTAGIAQDTAAAIIIEHSIDLAHALGLHALAEGVEEPADLQLLAAMGCDTVQGWLVGRPMPLTDWTTHLEDAQARNGHPESSGLVADATMGG